MTVTPEQVRQNLSFTTFSASKRRIKLTAAEQRSIFFGKYLFGKKNLKVEPYGISTMIRVAYGQDYDIQSYTWQQIAEMINS